MVNGSLLISFSLYSFPPFYKITVCIKYLLFHVILLFVAKNVILGGVKSVVVHDTELAELMDLSSQVSYRKSDSCSRGQ